MIQKILIIPYDVRPMKSKLKLHERYYGEKHHPISKQMFYNKTIEKLATADCFD